MKHDGAKERLTSKDAVEFINLLNSESGLYRYLHRLNDGVDIESLTSREFFKTSRAIIEGESDGTKPMFNYAIEHGFDKERLEEARKVVELGYTGRIYVRMASASDLFGLKNAEERIKFMGDVLNRMPKSSYDNDSEFFKIAISDFVAKNANLLSPAEADVMTQDISYTLRNGASIIEFLDRRRNPKAQVCPFTEKKIKNGVISEHMIKTNESVSITRDEAIDMLVRGLNGSRDKASETASREKLRSLFGTDTANRGYDSWKKSATKEDVKRLAASYSAYQSKKDEESAKNLVATFKSCLEGKEQTVIHEISDMIGTLEPVINGEKLSIAKGERIVAFYTSNQNAITTKSNNTGCCAFTGGVNSHAGIRYANDDNMALVDFTITNEVKADFSDSTVYGVAISLFAKVDGKKALFVDSVEGGLLFAKSIKERQEYVTDSLKSFAKETGCECLAFSTNPHNNTPLEFVNSLSATAEKHEVEPLSRPGQYLEGLGSEGKQTVEVKLVAL